MRRQTMVSMPFVLKEKFISSAIWKMDDVKLIGEVEKYKELYDSGSPSYKDSTMKDTIWNAISLAIGAQPDECKQRWKYLRDSFVRRRKNHRPGVGYQREWKYTSFMSFLLPHLQRRSKKNTFDVEKSLDYPADLSGTVDEEDVKEDLSHLMIAPLPQPEEPETDARSGSDTPLPWARRGHSYRGHTPQHEELDEALRPRASSPPTPVEVQSRKRRRGSLGVEDRLFGIVADSTPSASSVPWPQDEMYHFALSIAPILSRLNPRVQAQAKIKILNLLDDLEQPEEPSPSDEPNEKPRKGQQSFLPVQTPPCATQAMNNPRTSMRRRMSTSSEEQWEELSTYSAMDPAGPVTPDMASGKAQIGKLAPDFKATALMPGGQFKDIKMSDFRGKYVVFFFYPLDFTFVCPTEIIAFSEAVDQFKKINCEVIGASVDSHFCHFAWTNTPRKQGGLGQMKIPLVADTQRSICQMYGVLKEDEGIAYRGLFIIDDKGILRQITINDLPVGRSVDETLRLVQAFQFTDKHGEVCPAGWKPGSDTIKPDVQKSKEFFSKQK
ncbi:uncharacterized protein LOC108935565 isoform X1 [Scleropages formosus]|uniref:thioredoxin-dependent peroxiredoxin n=4 Tax=Scleropages formosus TaxID=113540 RepID=A0A8C9V8A3_SCLFO|nr:uncharacterized protein LOC108935565 isoform X1 [Scleropages formosus]